MGRLGDGEDEDVMCVTGHVDLSRDRGGLLRSALPELIHVRGDTAEAPTLRWLVERLADEMATGRAGSERVSDHLAQLLFVHVLRVCLAHGGHTAGGLVARPGRRSGWPRPAPDARRPGRPWSLEDLARAAAMSRTSFALRFSRPSAFRR